MPIPEVHDACCWQCGTTYANETAEPATGRGGPRDGAGAILVRVRCPQCRVINFSVYAADRLRAKLAGTNRIEML